MGFAFGLTASPLPMAYVNTVPVTGCVLVAGLYSALQIVNFL